MKEEEAECCLCGGIAEPVGYG
ncbi:hypothetical protein LCGC14_2989620, partial [marine sediment metagenome]